MTTNTANNINTARRAANSNAKAEQIIREGYAFHKDKDMDSVAVVKPGRLAASYWIVDGECDCPDFLRHGMYCKHTIAWGILEDERENMEAQCREYDLRIAMEF